MKFFYGFALLLVAAFSYYMGSTVGMFGGNLCYSKAISEVSKIYLSALNTEDKTEQELTKAFMQSIPNYGYETTCNELRAYINRYIEDKE